MKKHLHTAFQKSEGYLSSFFQKLPDLLILIAIPTVLVFYIFLRPQPQSKTISEPVTTESMLSESGEDVDSTLRSLFGDVQKDVVEGSGSAQLATLGEDATPSSSLQTGVPSIDLVGPWSCETSDENGDAMKLYIEKKSVKTVIQKSKSIENMLLKDQCIYSWTNNGSGKKQCTGVSDLVSIAEFASQSGLVDIESVIEQVGGASAGMMKSLVSSCRKTSIGEHLFVLPQGIKWVEDNTLLDSLQK